MRIHRTLFALLLACLLLGSFSAFAESDQEVLYASLLASASAPPVPTVKPEPAAPAPDIDISIKIDWRDAQNSMKTRPSEVVVTLRGDGNVYGRAILNSGNEWKYTFYDLPSSVQYAISEHEIEDYKSVNWQTSYGFYVRNTYAQPLSIEPFTGDESQPLFWLALMVVSLTALGLLFYRRRSGALVK